MKTLAMRSVVLSVVLLAVVGGAPSTSTLYAAGENVPVLPEDYSCNFCHSKDGELWDEGTPLVHEQDLARDIHWQRGLRCHDCHGGSPTMDEFANHRADPTFRSMESPADIPTFCGHCHSSIQYMRQYDPSARTDQEQEYWTSGHGRRLQETAEAGEPDSAVATCVDCHGHHGILAVRDANSPVYPTRVAETCARCHSDPAVMADRSYNDRPVGHHQFEQWRQSVHGQALMDKGDLAAATCNDCHGNHGAMPPGVASVANACGTCHGKVAKLFSETRMRHRFEEVGLPGCATCHGSHLIVNPTDEMLGMSAGAVCVECHNPDNPQYGAAVTIGDTARAMREGLEELKREIARAGEMIQAAERLGMEIHGPRFDLRQAEDALINARTLVHSFHPDPLQEALREGLDVTSSVQAAADRALREHTRRRVWLAMSLAPLLLVIGVLLLYIRTLPASAPPSPDLEEHRLAGPEK